ncbi:hypothetical protein [Streptomyces hainanensis]|uniref:Uncharacterized protein n=1 Tax=Streptomyces hainanensis TaxID=402648 RepID=A0A4R4TSC1_9ACTN|nr:hypothetical protein [Streptomyces hainanensis]TDC79696.1 hypothetical protein E1283_02100 [Streptomyces hainanensis]
METRARFGFTAAPGSTDYPRLRRITETVDLGAAAALLAAHQAGADETELRGTLGQGLDVEITNIDYLDLS